MKSYSSACITKVCTSNKFYLCTGKIYLECIAAIKLVLRKLFADSHTILSIYLHLETEKKITEKFLWVKTVDLWDRHTNTFYSHWSELQKLQHKQKWPLPCKPPKSSVVTGRQRNMAQSFPPPRRCLAKSLLFT